MRRQFALDIETEPNVSLADELPAPEIKLGNLKDPVKIAEKEEEATRKQRERMALSGDFGRVISVAFAWRDRLGDIATDFHCRRPDGGDVDEAEMELLELIADRIHERVITPDDGQLVTWNGAAFDLPFLVRRGLHLQVRMPEVPWRGWRRAGITADHIDAYEALSETDTAGAALAPCTLTYNAWMLLGMRPPEGHADKTSYADWRRAGDTERLRAANVWDAVATLRLGEMVAQYL